MFFFQINSRLSDRSIPTAEAVMTSRDTNKRDTARSRDSHGDVIDDEKAFGELDELDWVNDATILTRKQGLTQFEC